MYRGFNLVVSNNPFSSHVGRGVAAHELQKATVEKVLASFKDSNGALIASEITENWFPAIRANVFISHSHADNDLAVGLSGWLLEKLGLTSFIDSSVWGYSNKLLKIMDNDYCRNWDRTAYDYEKRNRSTSHVHMMLSVALYKMMDQCECVIFLNTPSSIPTKNYISGTNTESPWIYAEIAMTSLIQRKLPAAHRETTVMEGAALEASMLVKYAVDLAHLTDLSYGDLARWKEQYQLIRKAQGSNSLDTLYDMKR